LENAIPLFWGKLHNCHLSGNRLVFRLSRLRIGNHVLVAVSEGAKMAAAVGATMPNLEGGGVPAGGTECLFDAGDKGMGEV
jgi:hypothetical protein